MKHNKKNSNKSNILPKDYNGNLKLPGPCFPMMPFARLPSPPGGDTVLNLCLLFASLIFWSS